MNLDSITEVLKQQSSVVKIEIARTLFDDDRVARVALAPSCLPYADWVCLANLASYLRRHVAHQLLRSVPAPLLKIPPKTSHMERAKWKRMMFGIHYGTSADSLGESLGANDTPNNVTEPPPHEGRLRTLEDSFHEHLRQQNEAWYAATSPLRSRVTEFRNASGLEFKDISSEEYRVYDLPGRPTPLRIENPWMLHASANGHRLLTKSGLCYYINLRDGWYIQWKPRAGQPHFVA